MKVIPWFAVVVWGACAQDRLTTEALPIPFGPNDKPSCVSLSEDGTLMAFQSRRPHGKGGADIWFSREQEGGWSAPYNAGPGINTSSNEVDGKLSPDGKSIVFIRGDDFKKASAIYISQFRNGEWANAEQIPSPVSLPGTVQFGAVLSRDGSRLYFSSNRPGGLGGFDIYYSDRKGENWSAPVNLGPPLNTPGDDADLALGRNGTVMILPARRPDSLGGVDLYLSRRRGNEWSSLVNLGPRINTPGNDACPWLGYDGKTLYLNSDWAGMIGGHQGPSAILKITYLAGF